MAGADGGLVPLFSISPASPRTPVDKPSPAAAACLSTWDDRDAVLSPSAQMIQFHEKVIGVSDTKKYVQLSAPGGHGTSTTREDWDHSGRSASGASGGELQWSLRGAPVAQWDTGTRVRRLRGQIAVLAEFAAKAVLMPLPLPREDDEKPAEGPCVKDFSTDHLLAFLRRHLSAVEEGSTIEEAMQVAAAAAEKPQDYLLAELAARKLATECDRPGFTEEDFDPSRDPAARQELEQWRQRELACAARNEQEIRRLRLSAKRKVSLAPSEPGQGGSRTDAVMRRGSTVAKFKRRFSSFRPDSGALPPATVSLELELQKLPPFVFMFRVSCGATDKRASPGATGGHSDMRRVLVDLEVRRELAGQWPGEMRLELLEFKKPKGGCPCCPGRPTPRYMPQAECVVPMAEHFREPPPAADSAPAAAPGAGPAKCECVLKGQGSPMPVTVSITVRLPAPPSACSKDTERLNAVADPMEDSFVDQVHTWCHDHPRLLCDLASLLPPREPETQALLGAYAAQYGLRPALLHLLLAQLAMTRAQEASDTAAAQQELVAVQHHTTPQLSAFLTVIELEVGRDVLSRLYGDLELRLRQPLHVAVRELGPGGGHTAAAAQALQGQRDWVRRLQFALRARRALAADADAGLTARRGSLFGSSMRGGDVDPEVLQESQRLFAQWVADSWTTALERYRQRVELAPHWKHVAKRGEGDELRAPHSPRVGGDGAELLVQEAEATAAGLAWCDGVLGDSAELPEFAGRRPIRLGGTKITPQTDLQELCSQHGDRPVKICFLSPSGLSVVARMVSEEHAERLLLEQNVFDHQSIRSTDICPGLDYLEILRGAGAAAVRAAVAAAVDAAGRARPSERAEGHAVALALYRWLRKQCTACRAYQPPAKPEESSAGVALHEVFGPFVRDWLRVVGERIIADFRAALPPESVPEASPQRPAVSPRGRTSRSQTPTNRRGVSPRRATARHSFEEAMQTDGPAPGQRVTDELRAAGEAVGRWLDEQWPQLPGEDRHLAVTPRDPDAPGRRRGSVVLGVGQSPTGSIVRRGSCVSPMGRPRRGSMSAPSFPKVGGPAAAPPLPSGPENFGKWAMQLHAASLLVATMHQIAEALSARLADAPAVQKVTDSLTQAVTSTTEVGSELRKESVQRAVAPLLPCVQHGAHLAAGWVTGTRRALSRVVPQGLPDQLSELFDGAEQGLYEALREAARRLSGAIVAALSTALRQACSPRPPPQQQQQRGAGFLGSSRKEEAQQPGTSPRAAAQRLSGFVQAVVTAAGAQQGGDCADTPLPLLLLSAVFAALHAAAADTPDVEKQALFPEVLRAARAALEGAVEPGEWNNMEEVLPPALQSAQQRSPVPGRWDEVLAAVVPRGQRAGPGAAGGVLHMSGLAMHHSGLLGGSISVKREGEDRGRQAQPLQRQGRRMSFTGGGAAERRLARSGSAPGWNASGHSAGPGPRAASQPRAAVRTPRSERRGSRGGGAGADAGGGPGPLRTLSPSGAGPRRPSWGARKHRDPAPAPAAEEEDDGYF
eukprot:TRINITY_DN3101_c0_g1_i1.p1 TRINITY_DN3101_c0_g1~~TRINITY_DN3101_c0_g1_i1.p1  ORF type:complete len:1524 (+),score=487.89 TRINITY_DN3101_c0_g1_i1:187-4758(+)